LVSRSARASGGVNRFLQFDYTTIGHVTIDVLDDGSRRAGGTAFYSAVQAARLGHRTLIVTQGRPAEVEELLEPHRNELELRVLPAPHTTTLRTRGYGSTRSQSMLAWAGAIDAGLTLDTSILHLAPIARESPSDWRGRTPFVGLTPQGLAREWGGAGAQIRSAQPAPDAAAVASRCHAVVVNEQERASCAGLLDGARVAGAVVAVTAGAQPTTILEPGRPALARDVPGLEHPVEDLGAGDVFAAAFFIALSERRSAPDAASFANAAAAVRMSGVGAGAIGDLQTIDARLRACA
jgi:1D-myo-inositol 3-kinase